MSRYIEIKYIDQMVSDFMKALEKVEEPLKKGYDLVIEDMATYRILQLYPNVKTKEEIINEMDM